MLRFVGGLAAGLWLGRAYPAAGQWLEAVARGVAALVASALEGGGAW